MADDISPVDRKEEQHTPPPGKFLVCVDKSDVSRVALHFACVKAKKRGGLVDMLHVIEPPADFQGLAAVAEKIREERREEAEELMQALAEEAGKVGITPSILLREGSIGEQIIEVAQEDFDINMLVLGASPSGSGSGRIISWLAGQLGDKLLIPLMLVPGNLTEQQIEELS